MTTIIVLLVLVVLALVFAWLAVRSRRARSGVLRWLGMIFSGLLALIFVAAAVILGVGLWKLNVAPYTYTTQNQTVDVSTADVARGEKLASLCIGCHSTAGKTP